MKKKFFMLVLILVLFVILLKNVEKDNETVTFNPLELEVGQVFNFLDKEENRVVLNYEVGDANGDTVNDLIIVIGEKSEKEIYSKNVDIVLYDNKTNEFVMANLKKYEGNMPKIFLKNIDGDGCNDIVVTLDTQNSGQKLRIVSFANNVPKEIWSEKENKIFDLSGNITEGFKANIKLKKLKKEFTVDLSKNKGNYITSGFYFENGKLRTNKTNINLAGLYNLDFVSVDGKTGIKLSARINGFDNLDVIEQINVIMKYENENWAIVEAMGEKSGAL